ncbi:unnamed protein product [Cuscuta campestris]|uniref:Uncharacterized protein n=1 Tax=Cuscuta campestris TaxID=132261 RepID=A0A484L5N8_9ASTE|nr:unnamed protein product [Cuscuta campestris]
MSVARAIRSDKKVTFVPLQKLSAPASDLPILVRVCRLWDAYSVKNNTELLSTDMVLIDEEGAYIHGIKGNLSHLFRNTIVEGGIYSINNFGVTENRNSFRVVGDSKIMIQMNATSIVRPAPAQVTDIPLHRFDFLDFDKVPMRLGKDYILTDVVGHVCGEGEVTDKKVYNNTLKSLMLELQELSGAKLRITLWGRSVADYITQKTAIPASVIVGVFTSNLVKEYMKRTTLSTTTATKVFLDVAIDEVAALKNKYSEEKTLKPLLVERAVVDQDTVLAGLNTIAEILAIASTDFKNGVTYYCHALIHNISNNNSWYYNSCGHCKGNSKFWCKKDSKLVDDAVPRYRLEAIVKDETEVTKFIIFDDEAEKLIGQSAISLYDMEEKLEDEETQGQLPALITNLIGQRFVFHVKLTEYNKTAYTQSFGANKVHKESIIGPMKNKETPHEASASATPSSPAIDNTPNKKMRLSENTDGAIGTA